MVDKLGFIGGVILIKSFVFTDRRSTAVRSHSGNDTNTVVSFKTLAPLRYPDGPFYNANNSSINYPKG